MKKPNKNEMPVINTETMSMRIDLLHEEIYATQSAIRRQAHIREMHDYEVFFDTRNIWLNKKELNKDISDDEKQKLQESTEWLNQKIKLATLKISECDKITKKLTKYLNSKEHELIEIHRGLNDTNSN